MVLVDIDAVYDNMAKALHSAWGDCSLGVTLDLFCPEYRATFTILDDPTPTILLIEGKNINKANM